MMTLTEILHEIVAAGRFSDESRGQLHAAIDNLAAEVGGPVAEVPSSPAPAQMPPRQ